MRIFSLPSIRFLGLLLGADCVFILASIGYQFTDVVSFDFYSVETDRGYAEIFQYIKEFWIVLLLVLYFVRNRQLIYLIWAVLFGYILIDDSFMIHEKLGTFFSEYFHFLPRWGLRPDDFGQFLVSCFFGLPLLLAMGLVYNQCISIHKPNVKTLFKLLLVYVLFGIGMDMMHSLANYFKVLQFVFPTLEDGGEMLVMSVITWYVYVLHDGHNVENKNEG